MYYWPYLWECRYLSLIVILHPCWCQGCDWSCEQLAAALAGATETQRSWCVMASVWGYTLSRAREDPINIIMVTLIVLPGGKFDCEFYLRFTMQWSISVIFNCIFWVHEDEKWMLSNLTDHNCHDLQQYSSKQLLHHMYEKTKYFAKRFKFASLTLHCALQEQIKSNIFYLILFRQ